MVKNFLSEGEAQTINNMLKEAQNVRLGDAVKTALQGGVGFLDNERYYVNGLIGIDTQANDQGKSKDKPFRTIMYALNVARYVPGTTTIDSSKNRRKIIYVAPGVYNEQILFSGYNISLIGEMYRVGNVDYGVVINKDEAVTSTAVVGFTGAGIEIANLQIHNAAAIPAIYVPTPGDGCYVHDCVIDNDDTNATYGIQWPDCRHSRIEYNKIIDFQTAGISVGGSGVWFRQSEIVGNKIAGSTGIGIEVATGTICTARQGSLIGHNHIIGTCIVGIHQKQAGIYVLIADNWIQAVTAVTDAGTGNCDNHTAS